MIKYQIQLGDNLTKILSRHSSIFGLGREFEDYKDDIIKWNKIKDPNKINVGAVLDLPKSSGDFDLLVKSRPSGISELEQRMPPPVPPSAPPVEMPIVKPVKPTTEMEVIEPESLIRGIVTSFQGLRKSNAIAKPYYEPGYALPTPTVSEHQDLLKNVEYQVQAIAKALKGPARQKALDQVTSQMYDAYRMKDPYLFGALKLSKRILQETWGHETI